MRNAVNPLQVRTGTARRVPGKPLESVSTARLPHERDETADGQPGAPRDEMAQAAKDLERGLVDTDCHGVRGVDQTAAGGAASACPVAPETRVKP